MAVTPRKLTVATVVLLLAILPIRQRLLQNAENTDPLVETPDGATARAPSSSPGTSSQDHSRSIAPPTTPSANRPRSNGDQALARLQGESRQKWQTILDPETGRLRTLEGGVLELKENDGSAGLVQAAQAFVERYALELFGVSPQGLRFDKIVETDRSKVVFEEFVDGRRVLGCTLALIFENGALVRVQSDLIAETAARPAGREVALEQAVRYATVNGGEKIATSPEKLGNVVKPVASIQPERVFLAHDDQLISAYAIYVDRFNSSDARVDRARVLVDAIEPRVIRIDKMLFN